MFHYGMKRLLDNLNIFRQCREFDVGVWSCPRFLFVLMGGIIIFSIIITHFIGERYASPEIVIALVTGLTVALMIIMHVIVQAFEQVVTSRREEVARAKEVLLLRDQFVYVAIHHLRAGGTAVKWGLKLLDSADTQSISSDGSKEIVRQMRKKNEDLLKLAENILLVTRIDSGSLAIGREEVAIREAVDGALADEKELIAERQVRVFVEIAPDMLPVMGDPIYVREMFGLLIEFAIGRLTGVSSPILRITAVLKGQEVMISVHDNGPMISENDIEHMFEHYWRSSGPGKSEGSGFPLYISHELVRLMQGRIWFTSVNNATSGTVALPIQ